MAVATEIEMKKTDVCMVHLLDGWMDGWMVGDYSRFRIFSN